MWQAHLTLICSVGLVACAGPKNMPPQAKAELQSAAGQKINGELLFYQQDSGPVLLRIKVAGLKPNSEHGFHIHMTGDCSKADFSSAGGHFNPQQHAHGAQAAEHHAGDIPNLNANADGLAETQFTLAQLSLLPGTNNIIGKAVIIHANPDDYHSQPAGNAGARIACAVIQATP
ncbi:superoxide dismutase family protein [Deefgea rivuli]|uniref:superoxide dismutase family protein n=1 Tax=Deefgea rivuli TaxID=400948 RepID=UPI0004807CAF|nr:superoxide dismutase family protein [Deefgea rivuli]